MTRGRFGAATITPMGLAFLASAVVLAGLIVLLAGNPRRWFSPQAAAQPLTVYVAAGLRTPVEAAAKHYEQTYGVPVQLHYGGSQTLLAGIETARRGDLYIPADDSYLRAAREKHLVGETLPLARMAPVAAVRRGNPLKIHSLADLLRPGVRLAQGNPDATAIGKRTRTAFQAAGTWETLKAHTLVFKMTVIEVANDVQVGAVDVGIVWDATVRQLPGLEAVPLSPLAGTTAHIAAAVLRTSSQPSATLRFARFLAAHDGGLPYFARNGYEMVEGFSWAESSESLTP